MSPRGRNSVSWTSKVARARPDMVRAVLTSGGKESELGPPEAYEPLEQPNMNLFLQEHRPRGLVVGDVYTLAKLCWRCETRASPPGGTSE